MPRYLYGGSYDAIAGQELNRDAARDQRYFQSIAASQRLREQMEQERYRQAQFALQQQQYAQHAAAQARAQNIAAAVRMAELQEGRARNTAIRRQQDRQLDLQEKAMKGRQDLGMDRLGLMEDKLEFEKNKPPRQYGAITPALKYKMALDYQRDQDLGQSVARLAKVLNAQAELRGRMELLDQKSPQRLALQRTLEANQAFVDSGAKSGALEFVSTDPSGKYVSTWKPMDMDQVMAQVGTGGSVAAPVNPKLPPGKTADDIRRDALQKIQEYPDRQAEIWAAVMERFGIGPQ